MWPGQQQPGYGDPQQPGYGSPRRPGDGSPQQPNPYLQPGYQQPNPYTGPTVEQQAVPPQSSPRAERRKTALVAIVAAVAVVATAVVTGVVVSRDGGDGSGGSGSKGSEAGVPGTGESGGRSGSGHSGSGQSGDAPAAPAENPRGVQDSKPTIAGWKVVTNPRHGTQFDVPASWTVAGAGISTFIEDRKKGGGAPLVTMSAPAHLTPEWCTADADKDGVTETSGLATAGTKGGKGAKDTRSAAADEAGVWVWGAYAQTEPKGTVRTTRAKPYTTASGLRGSMATATAVGVEKDSKCATDGKSVAFTFEDGTGEFRTWVVYAAKGVPDEIPDATIERILSTVRLTSGPAD
ncbi:hypothetical protein [Streptomyces jumonjinensis]|uniref:DUF8017 domain-containing protein n=1 Tax=Streptomyces jumonjinensis TaxID=1945 RepID=A0A646KFP7_STRJU|nr:hypothetical protein [Streptomyces jumonjinensis]MQT00938.1 hypothetical protein [Streptomyces jumonjinensis]